MRLFSFLAVPLFLSILATCSSNSATNTIDVNQSKAAATCSPTPTPLASPPPTFDLYVDSADKSNSTDGSQQHPFHTIKESLAEVVRQRTKGEALSKKENVWIKVLAGKGYVDPVLIDVSQIRLVGGVGQEQLPKITNHDRIIVSIKSSDILFQGFEISNGEFQPFTSNKNGLTGIEVAPSSTNITIANNKIHTIGVNYPGQGKYGQAHAINAWSYDSYDTKGKLIATSGEIQSLFILNNVIYELHLGQSEAVSVNGKVKDFVISGNTFSDLDNIAIDIGGLQEDDIGGDEEGKPQPWQAQKGFVANNELKNVYASLTPKKVQYNHYNPGQADEHGKLIMVGAIYVDGGTQVTITRNTVSESAIGIDVGSEKAGRVRDVLVANNFVYHNRSAGIKIADGDSKVVTTIIANNTLIDNNYPSAIDGPVFDNGSLYFGDGYVCGVMVGNNLISGATGKTLVTNVHSGPLKCDPEADKPDSDSSGKCKTDGPCTLTFVANGFNGDKSNFQNDSTWEDFRTRYQPQQIEFQPFYLTANFQLTASSPARDRGDKSVLPPCELLDRDNYPRIVNGEIDLGAFEFR